MKIHRNNYGGRRSQIINNCSAKTAIVARFRYLMLRIIIKCRPIEKNTERTRFRIFFVSVQRETCFREAEID